MYMRPRYLPAKVKILSAQLLTDTLIEEGRRRQKLSYSFRSDGPRTVDVPIEVQILRVRGEVLNQSVLVQTTLAASYELHGETVAARRRLAESLTSFEIVIGKLGR